MLLFLLLKFTKQFTPSRFGYTGTDTVQAQECDSLVILHEVEKPEVRYINESGWVNPPIKYEEYGWPGHMKTADNERLQAETSIIFDNYLEAHDVFPKDKLFAHPAGVNQFEGDAKLVNEAPRYKFRLFMNTRY